MKYLNYIVRGDFNIDSIVSKNRYLYPPTVILGIVVSTFGLVALTGMLPFAGVADGVRYVKLKRYAYLKVKNRQRVLNKMYKSLNVSKNNIKHLNIIINELVA